MNIKPIKIAVVDDHTLFLDILCKYLSEQNELELVYSCKKGNDIIEYIKKDPTNIDVLIIDYFLEDMLAYKVIEYIAVHDNNIRPIIISGAANDMVISNLIISKSIFGYIKKNMVIEELLKAIHFAFSGKVYINDSIKEALAKQYESKLNNTNGHLFTPAELHLLKLLSNEVEIAESAAILNYSVSSIEHMRSKMKGKAGVKTLHGLIAFAIKHGYLELNV